MICIQFQRKEELNFLYMLFQKVKTDFIQVEKNGNQLDITILNANEEEALPILHEQIKKFIMGKKRIDWCKRILAEEFFYTDEDEQVQIIDMVYSILEGKRKEVPIDIEHVLLEEQVDQRLMDVLKTNESFSMDAFITFRLRFYIEQLASFIEIAIDEYKMEQEYQDFIFYLRNFLDGRHAQMKYIHVVDGDGFRFFDDEKVEIKRSELNKRIDRKLLSHHPVYVDSVTIAPLISIAPEMIYLYTDHPEYGLIRTLKNIFEEKLKIQPLKQFHAVFGHVQSKE